MNLSTRLTVIIYRWGIASVTRSTGARARNAEKIIEKDFRKNS